MQAAFWYPGCCLVLSGLAAGSLVRWGAGSVNESQRFQLPPGLVIEKVAGPPLIRSRYSWRSMTVADDSSLKVHVPTFPGRNSSSSKNSWAASLCWKTTTGKGFFDVAKTFADDLTFPAGVLWHDGVVYVASHPCLWCLEDTDGESKADHRQPLVSGFKSNGNGCDIHGPFLGPDGWLY